MVYISILLYYLLFCLERGVWGLIMSISWSFPVILVSFYCHLEEYESLRNFLFEDHREGAGVFLFIYFFHYSGVRGYLFSLIGRRKKRHAWGRRRVRLVLKKQWFNWCDHVHLQLHLHVDFVLGPCWGSTVSEVTPVCQHMVDIIKYTSVTIIETIGIDK